MSWYQTRKPVRTEIVQLYHQKDPAVKYLHSERGYTNEHRQSSKPTLNDKRLDAQEPDLPNPRTAAMAANILTPLLQPKPPQYTQLARSQTSFPPLTVATPVPPPHDLTFHPLLSLNLEPPQPVYYASSRTTSPWNQTNRPRKVPLLYALCHVQPRNLHSGLQPPEIGKKTITPVITTWQLSPCCCQGLSRRRGSANKSGQVPAETTPPSPWAGAGASARERGRGEVRPWPRVRIGPVFGCPSPPPKKFKHLCLFVGSLPLFPFVVPLVPYGWRLLILALSRICILNKC